MRLLSTKVKKTNGFFEFKQIVKMQMAVVLLTVAEELWTLFKKPFNKIYKRK